MRIFAICLVIVALGAASTPTADGSSEGAALCRSIAKPPLIDGKLDDAAWQALPALSGFTVLRDGQPASPATSFSICHDEDAIFVALRCAEPDMDAVECKLTEADADVFEEECVVVLFDVGHERRPSGFVELAANCLGTKHDAFDDDHQWSGAWRAAAQRGPDGWTLEIAVPFGDLGRRPASGDMWGLAVGRYRNVEGEQVFTWSPVQGSFWDTETFGHVIFDSLERNLMRDIAAVEERLSSERQDVARLAKKFGADDAYVGVVVAAAPAVGELHRRVEGGVRDADEWRNIRDALARIEDEYDDALWNLRLEELFAD